jgi:hypothetical protein
MRNPRVKGNFDLWLNPRFSSDIPTKPMQDYVNLLTKVSYDNYQ